MSLPRFCVRLFLATLLTSLPLLAQGRALPGAGWPTYGGPSDGTRFSSGSQITPANIPDLRPAWIFHTHALDRRPDTLPVDASFESTPILSGRTLYLTSPFDVVFALDALTGAELWSFDPHVASAPDGSIVTSRGVALWHSAPTAVFPGLPCSSRIFLGTIDARLLALDAATGASCVDFGDAGFVDLRPPKPFAGPYGITSPPTILGNAVIVGSLIGDNQQVDAPSGLVRAFDALSGRLLWSWEPLPWAAAQHIPTGAANTWSVITADPTLGLVYLPTGSPSPDYFGGLRPGDNRDANSLVALDAATGRKVWSFQVVHHDLWDYDIASQPLLFTFHGLSSPHATPGPGIPAIAVTTKMGFVFVLDRRTGAPLSPVHERPVPQTDVPGESTSPTQPFPDLPALNPTSLTTPTNSIWQRSPDNQRLCRDQLAGLRSAGIYTPPSLRGSVIFPGNLGGVNWGSAALDPATGILYANTNRIAFSARLVPRHGRAVTRKLLRGLFFDWADWGVLAGLVLFTGTLISRTRTGSWRPGYITLSLTSALMLAIIPISRHVTPSEPVQLAHFGYELSEQRRSPYLIERNIITDSDGLPCTPPPWGATTAIDLNTGHKLWEVPLGSRIPGRDTGIVNFGGPIVTASGLVFTGAAEDPFLRAFNASNGRLLWQYQLPDPAQSTPMTYTIDGRQFLVIAAGGHGDRATPLGDSLVAFTVHPEPAPSPVAPSVR